MDYRPAGDGAAAPPTIANSIYLAAQWAISGSTVAGRVYRLIVLAAATVSVAVLVDLAQR